MEEHNEWNSKKVNAFVYREADGNYTMVDLMTEERHTIPDGFESRCMFKHSMEYCYLVYWFKETNYKYFKPLISCRARFVEFDRNRNIMSFYRLTSDKQIDSAIKNAKLFKETYGA